MDDATRADADDRGVVDAEVRATGIASEGDARRERETREGMGIIPRWLEDPEPENAARNETNG